MQRDTVRWASMVGPGPTNILFYHGAPTGRLAPPAGVPAFQSQGFHLRQRGINLLHIKKDISATPATGSTPTAPLRNGKALRVQPVYDVEITSDAPRPGRYLWNLQQCPRPASAGRGRFFWLDFPRYRGSIIPLYRGWCEQRW